jgi:hypothetical protein
MSDRRIILHLGPTSVDQHELVVPAHVPLIDLMIGWKKDYRLPEQDQQGELIRYVVYRGRGSEKVQLDLQSSLRRQHISEFEALYLSDERRIWWANSAAPPPAPSGNPAPRQTEPLSRGKRKEPSPSERSTASTVLLPCSVELAPNCVRQVPETGLVINREYLLATLPKSVVALEHGLNLIGRTSRLLAVSRGEPGHCSIVRQQNWYLVAHNTVYIGSAKYRRNEALPLDQTVTVLLGREGWPITIRLHSTAISR